MVRQRTAAPRAAAQGKKEGCWAAATETCMASQGPKLATVALQAQQKLA